MRGVEMLRGLEDGRLQGGDSTGEAPTHLLPLLSKQENVDWTRVQGLEGRFIGAVGLRDLAQLGIEVQQQEASSQTPGRTS